MVRPSENDGYNVSPLLCGGLSGDALLFGGRVGRGGEGRRGRCDHRTLDSLRLLPLSLKICKNLMWVLGPVWQGKRNGPE